MKKAIVCLVTVLCALLVYSCRFSPIVAEEQLSGGSGAQPANYKDYLAIMKTTAQHTSTVAELEKMVEGLLNSDDSVIRSADNSVVTTVSGSKKLNFTKEKYFAQSSAARFAGVTEEEPVEIYSMGITSTEKEGFVITCNDNRIGNILAIVDNGSLDNSEGNPFTKIFFERLEMYVDGIIAQYEAISQEDVKSAFSKVNYTDHDRSVLEGDNIHGSGNDVIFTLGNPAYPNQDFYPPSLFDHFYPPPPGMDGEKMMIAEWSWTDGHYTPIPVEWSQGGSYANSFGHISYEYPYNAVVSYPGMVTDVNGSTAHGEQNYLIAGCGPVAVAQLMAYHRYPTACTLDLSPYKSGFNANNPYGYDWTAMTARTKITTPFVYLNPSPMSAIEGVGILMYEIGKRSNSEYHPAGRGGVKAKTETWEDGIIKALIEMGYTVPSSRYEIASNGKRRFKSYGNPGQSPALFNAIQESIILGRPVLAGGFDTDGTGHCWVIDGTRNMYYTETFYSGGYWNFSGLHNFVHCNMGWENYNTNNIDVNGWYICGIFDTNYVSWARSTGPSDYSSDVRVLTHVSH